MPKFGRKKLINFLAVLALAISFSFLPQSAFSQEDISRVRPIEGTEDGNPREEIDWNSFGINSPGYTEKLFETMNQWFFNGDDNNGLWKKRKGQISYYLDEPKVFSSYTNRELAFSRLNGLATLPFLKLIDSHLYGGEKRADIRVYFVESIKDAGQVFKKTWPQNEGKYNWHQDLLNNFQVESSATVPSKCLIFSVGDNFLIKHTLAFVEITNEELLLKKFSPDTIACSYKILLSHSGAFFIDSADTFEVVFRTKMPSAPSLDGKVFANDFYYKALRFLYSDQFQPGMLKEDFEKKGTQLWAKWLDDLNY